jgi:hypothetical protein
MACRAALKKTRPLAGGLAIAVAIWLVLNLTTFLIPVAIWFAVRWFLLAQVVEVEGATAIGGLRRSQSSYWVAGLQLRRWSA